MGGAVRLGLGRRTDARGPPPGARAASVLAGGRGGHARRLIEGSLIAPQLPLFLAFAWTSLVNYGFGLVASRLLGPGDFGLLAFAQSILLLSGFVLQSGVPWTLTRDMVPAPPERRGALVRGALLTNGAIAVGLGAVIGLLYVAGPLQRGLEAAPVLAAVLVALPLFAVSAVARAAAQGVHAFGRVGVIQTVEVTFKAIVGLALAAIGFGALGAVAGFAVGGIVAAAVGIVLVVRRVPLRARSLAWPALRSVGPMFGALLGLALILNLDLMAMKLLVEDRAATGQYQAAIILANAPYFLVSSAIVPVLFTRLAVHGRLDETRDRVAEALRLAVGLALPIELLLVVVPDVALRLLFPAAYGGAAPVLRLMAVGNGALITVAVVTAAFQAIDRSAEVGRILLAIVPVEIVALVVVVPRFGALGAVASFDVAALVAAIVLGLRYISEAKVPVGPIGRWLGRFGFAVAAGGVVALATWSVANVYVACVAAGAVYYGLVLALGVVPRPRVARLGPRLFQGGRKSAIGDRAVTRGRAATPEDG